MSGTKEIKRRIKSVKNTKKITKAMELVAASKMRRAVSSTLASRTYARYAWDVLQSLTATSHASKHPLLSARPVKNILTVVVTSNRGLCGAYNAQVLKKMVGLLKSEQDNSKLDFIIVGKKGGAALRRLKQNIVASFTELPEHLSFRDTKSISNLIIGDFTAGKYDQVLFIYTDYISALTQKPNIRQLLPIRKEDLQQAIENLDISERQTLTMPSKEYLFEPQAKTLLPQMVEKLAQMQVYQFLLESFASEQSSRMLAMRNATDAAGEMIDNLTLVFNKARQANITKEISEISAGMASVE